MAVTLCKVIRIYLCLYTGIYSRLLTIYKNIHPVQGAEEKVKKGYASPNNLEEANKLVNDCKVKNVEDNSFGRADIDSTFGSYYKDTVAQRVKAFFRISLQGSHERVKSILAVGVEGYAGKWISRRLKSAYRTAASD